MIVVAKKTTNENKNGNKNHSLTHQVHASVLKLNEKDADNKNKKAITIILQRNQAPKTPSELISTLTNDIFLGLCKCSSSI